MKESRTAFSFQKRRLGKVSKIGSRLRRFFRQTVAKHFSNETPAEQSVTLVLALTEKFLAGVEAGACRVHGGGFAGTIQVILPTRFVNDLLELLPLSLEKNV